MQHDDGGMWYTLVSVIRVRDEVLRTENNLFSMVTSRHVYDLFLMTTKTVVRIALIVANYR